MAKFQVGFDRVHALFLQLICVNLVHQSDTAPFLIKVEHHAFTFLLDEAHSLVQLFAAIASHRPEDIACHARRVDADEHRLVCVQFAFDQYHMFRPVAFLAERNDAETSVLGWQVGLDPLLYERFCSEAVGNQVAYGDDLDAEFFRDFDQLRHARHRSVFVQDFDQRSGRI